MRELLQKSKFNCQKMKIIGLNNKLKKNQTPFYLIHYHLEMPLLPNIQIVN